MMEKTQTKPKVQNNYGTIALVYFSLCLTSLFIYLLNTNGDGEFQIIELISFVFIIFFFFLAGVYFIRGETE